MLSDGWVPGQAGFTFLPYWGGGEDAQAPKGSKRGGGLGGCVYRLSLPRHGGPEGGGFGKWTSLTPRGRKPIFPHPFLILSPCLGTPENARVM